MTGNGSTREYGRSAALVTAAIGASGFLTYLFFAVSSHALSRDDYGQVVVLWSAMFVGLSLLCRPVEVLLARSIASLRARDGSIDHTLRVAARLQATVLGLFICVAVALKGPIEDALFAGDSLFFWALVASIVGFGASFFARGFLAGEGRFTTYSGLVVGDAIVRLLFALTVAVGLVIGPAAVALGIAVAPALSALVWPASNAWVRRRGHVTRAGGGIPSNEASITMLEGSGFASAVLLVMFSEQVLLNSGPLLARAEVGVAAAGFAFNVLLVARAPVVLFQAVATTLLPHLTRIQGTSEVSAERDFETSVRLTLGAIAIFGIAVLIGILAIGPALMEIAFGSKFEYPKADLLIVAAGLPFYLGATTLTQADLARGHVVAVAGTWLTSALLLLAFYLADPIDDVMRRIEVGFAGSSLILFTGLGLVYLRRRSVRLVDD